MRSRRALFLHWGPGSDAATERRWFGASLPVHWWDQPAVFAEPARAYGELVDAATAELRRMSAEQGGPVWILAHSFGGQLARSLAAQAPTLIAGMTLVSCGSNAVAPFANLGRRLGRLGLNASTELLAAAYEASPAPATFWPLMGEIAGTAGFFDLYWKNPEAKSRYLALNPGGPPLKMDAFQAIIDSRLASDPQAKSQPPAPFPVICCLGAADPLANGPEEELSWKSLFPGAVVRHLDAGHFIHLETEPAAWSAELTGWARGASSG